MKVTTYLVITLLSVMLQFAVLGLLQSSQKLKNTTIDLNISSPNKGFHDVIKGPHALYYRTKMNAVIEKNNITTKIYTNSSLTDISLKTTTDFPSTTFDILYDENVSMSTTEDTLTSTELFSTELEYDNVTDITLFEKRNTSLVKPKYTPKKTVTKECPCDLLYQVCDINCCCDSDCMETQLTMFPCLDEPKQKDAMTCDAQHHSLTSYLIGTSVDNLFCVAKTNLPERRVVKNYMQHDPSTLNKSLKWHANNNEKTAQKFEKKIYRYGDYVWVLRNGSVYYIDLPSIVTNNYCSERKPLKFLQNVQINCNAKLADLEIFQILSLSDNESVVSVTEKTQNASVLNCTSMHCTNWTTVVCDGSACVKYDRNVHETLCLETFCTNLALRVDYLFYYYDSKITNVTIKFYVHNVTLNKPFFIQQVNVNFLLANESLDQIISLSGNPGYVSGLPVIVSYAEGNYTESFFNQTSQLRYLPYPDNAKGLCTTPSLDKKFVLFGINQQMKSRYYYADFHNKVLNNATQMCINIQNSIKLLLGLKKNFVVSPYGNPRDIQDSQWITVPIKNLEESQVFGEIDHQTKLLCYNLLIRASYIFTYADASEIEGRKKNKILSTTFKTTLRNITFNVEEISVVVTFDTMFIDESKPNVYQYATSPHLNIHLPKDFFFPFPNNAHICKCNVLVIIACMLFPYQQIK